jgi:hypothetical protein
MGPLQSKVQGQFMSQTEKTDNEEDNTILNSIDYIVACKPIARQRPQNKQLDNNP